VSTERGTAGSERNPRCRPTKVVPYLSLGEDPFNRGLLRSVRSTDGETALPGRGSLASGSRFLLITTNVIIDSVDTPPPEDESYLSLGSILKDTPGVYFSTFN
jgi:hypothetical protein